MSLGHKDPNVQFKRGDFNIIKIPINENFYVISVYRQSVDKNLTGFDPSATGPPEEWDEFSSTKNETDQYAGNWRDYQVNAYGYCFYFTIGKKIILQWDLFYPRGAHIHYDGRSPAKGIVGDPIDWAYEILSDVELFNEHIEMCYNEIFLHKIRSLNLTLEDLQPLKNYIEGVDRNLL